MMLFNITLINNFSICYSILIVRNKVIFYQRRIVYYMQKIKSL